MSRGIDFALSMFDFNATPVEMLRQEYFCKPRPITAQGNSTESILIDESQTSCFRVNRIDVLDSYVRSVDDFYIAIVAKGSGSVTVGDATWRVQEGSRFFVPHQTGAVTFRSDKGMEIIATAPPRAD